MGSISENLKAVRQRIELAAARCGRAPSSIKLVAVSKTKTAGEIAQAVAAGQLIFGENYAQELKEKFEKLSTIHEIEWHFIGHLQKNKAKMVAPIASWIETVDSPELAEAIDKRATAPIDCLIEVNIGSEDTKSGVPPALLPDMIRGFGRFTNLNLRGLMIIPPFSSDPESSRPHFRRIKALLDELNSAKTSPPLTDLSMGMSHDFEVAIEEGATIIRVGTAIFGERD